MLLNFFHTSVLLAAPLLGIEFLRTYYQVNHTDDGYRVRVMKDLRWSCRQERIALIEWYFGFCCFIMGMLFDDQLYISSFISGAVYILESLEIQFSMCQLTESASENFFSPFISYGSSLDIGYKKKRNYWFFHFILCQLEMERPCDFIRTLTQLCRCLHGR